MLLHFYQIIVHLLEPSIIFYFLPELIYRPHFQVALFPPAELSVALVVRGCIVLLHVYLDSASMVCCSLAKSLYILVQLVKFLDDLGVLLLLVLETADHLNHI